MRAGLVWRHAQPGVLLYTPAPRVSIDDTEQSLSQLRVLDCTSSVSDVQTQLSEVSDTVRQSCENEPTVSIKTEPIEVEDSESVCVDSPDTLAGDDTEDIFADAVLVRRPEASVTTTPDYLSQLMAAAMTDSDISEFSNPSLTQYQIRSKLTATVTEDYVDIGYDSERTDFQEETPSPCVRTTQLKCTSVTEQTPDHSQRKAQLISRNSPVRCLDFEKEIKKQLAKTTKKSANAQARESVRSLERAPNRTWDEDERELLCVIYRWYCTVDRNSTRSVLPEVFNRITGLSLTSRKIHTQFDNLRRYGGDAYRVFRRVFEVSFNDPEGRYAEIRALIESEAEVLNIPLGRRRSDLYIQSGMARYDKSPKIRKAYKALVRKASQETRHKENEVLETCQTTLDSRSIASISMGVRAPTADNLECITDAETEVTPLITITKAHNPKVHNPSLARPNMTFRVWDASNKTRFVEGSFVAHAFIDWPRPLPPPIALDEASQAGKILASLHLSKEGDTPVFISTATSLLQVLSYAADMNKPQIALIDLDSSVLQGEHKVHHAADVFRWLKSHGLARWARYKGHGEYFVFSDIPSDAILHTFDVSDLVQLLNNDPDCRQLFNFEIFRANTKTRGIAATLRERYTMMNASTARALGKAAKAFGMCHSNVKLEHLSCFVARLVDGWSIMEADQIDVHRMSSLSAVFATALGPHARGYTLSQVMSAFMQGVENGTHCIAHWSRSRSGTRRQRFRDA